MSFKLRGRRKSAQSLGGEGREKEGGPEEEEEVCSITCGKRKRKKLRLTSIEMGREEKKRIAGEGEENVSII